MIETTDEYRIAARAFKKKFGYGVPLSMIPDSADTMDLIDKLYKCIADGNDNLMELYGVEISDDILY